MTLAVGMAVGMMLIQTAGAYLRYLPFEANLTREERTRLWKYILLWMPVTCTLYVTYYLYVGVNVETFKSVQYFGWIPFLLLSLVVIRNEGMRHTFVLGMQTLWFTLLHSVSGSLILLLMPPHYGTGLNRIVLQTAIYLLLFILLLPLEQKIFRNLLPTTLFSKNSWAGWCLAILPYGLCATPIITLIERPLMYTATDQIARFFILFWGFLLYQYSLYAGRHAANMQDERHTNELLTRQLHALESQALLMEARADDLRRICHDLRHYNRLLVTLLDAGKIEEARALIETQDKELLSQPITTYCQSPIVNAALTVYAQMAAKEGIRMHCGMHMNAPPEAQGERDSDLAILLSNVTENAIIASRKQPENRREISVSLAFVALKGEKVDGHDFIPQALAAGAVEVIDGLDELQRRAHERRRALKARVVALTGSAGKTTTKEFLKTFLGCYGTEGNYNNHIGLPLTILNCPEDAEFLVLEMGTNHPGEIKALCDIAEPDVGVIASIGTAHIEFFGTQEGIAEEKGTLFAATKDFNVVSSACNRLDILRRLSKPRLVEVDVASCGLDCPLPGAHNRSNMALAYAAARELGVPHEACAARLKDFALPGARWRKTEKWGATFIDDTYNANPDSMIAALDTFAAMPCDGRRIAVLGDMFELGERSLELHRKVFDHAMSLGLFLVIGVGETSAQCLCHRVYKDLRSLKKKFRLDVSAGDLVLLKASHAMHLGDLIADGAGGSAE